MTLLCWKSLKNGGPVDVPLKYDNRMFDCGEIRVTALDVKCKLLCSKNEMST